MRFCNRCGCDTHRYADGRCKPCVRARNATYYAANPEKIRAYRAANCESIRAYQAAYYADNRAANIEKERARDAARYAANRERAIARRAAHYVANPETYRIRNQNRRARKREAGGKLSPGLAEKLFKLQRGKCACCGEPLGADYHLDHIMPLALGGTNTDDNIQLLRQLCNNQKHAKHPVDFMQQRGFLL